MKTTTKFVTASGKGLPNESRAIAKKVAEESMKKLGKKPDMTIVYCDVSYDVKEVLKGVREATNRAPLVGCTSYGEFTEDNTGMGTVSMALISSDDMKFFPALAKGLKEDFDRTTDEFKQKLPENVDGFPYKYGLLYIDGMTGLGEEVALATSLKFPEVSLVGGGAVDMSMRNTYVFLNDETVTDGAVLCLILSKKKMGMSVTHGTSPSFGPLKVTKAKDNIVFELNNRPAWDVWKETIAEDARKRFGIDVSKISTKLEDIMPILMNYEPGLKIDDKHYKVRGAFSVTESGAMVFMCGVTQGSELYVMTCTLESTIDAAKRGSREAVKSLGGKPSGALVVDCAARGMMLGNNFPKAAEAINKGIDAPLLGFEAMGEICMAPGQFSGFHNSTIVTLALPE